MTYREMTEALDYGIETGRLIAAVRDDGEIGYHADIHATPELLRNKLSVAEVRRLRRVFGGVKI